jgi:hypothetical protein
MSEQRKPKPHSDQPLVYEIKIEGHLGTQWKDWFDGMTMQLNENGETVLTGPVADQPALHGLLKKVRDLGMSLISVNGIVLEPGGEPEPNRE